MGYNPRGHTESDTTERPTLTHTGKEVCWLEGQSSFTEIW